MKFQVNINIKTYILKLWQKSREFEATQEITKDEADNVMITLHSLRVRKKIFQSYYTE
jgi:hypothetical protein